MSSKQEIIKFAEREFDRALEQAAIAGAAVQFARSGEHELAERAVRILKAEQRRPHR